MRLDVFGTHIRRGSQSVHDDLTAKIAPKLRNIFIVGIEHRGSTCGQGLNQFVLRAGNSCDGIEKLQVHRRDVGHDADFRLRHLAQRGDLARARHAHFDDCEVMFRFDFQQHQGKSKMIIEIAFGSQHSKTT